MVLRRGIAFRELRDDDATVPANRGRVAQSQARYGRAVREARADAPASGGAGGHVGDAIKVDAVTRG